MFGSNFTANFGIPDFPYQGADAQGGYLAPNAPGQDPSQNAAPSIGQPTTNPVASTGEIGGAAAPASPSPLAGGPLAPGGAGVGTAPAPAPEAGGAAPAAGIGSPFGKPQV